MKKWRKWDIDCIQSSIWILAAISVCIYGGLEVIVWVLMEDNRATADNPWPVARYIFNSLWCEEKFNTINVYNSTFWNLLGGEENQAKEQSRYCSSIAPVIRHSITGNNEIKRESNIIMKTSNNNNINININKNNSIIIEQHSRKWDQGVIIIILFCHKQACSSDYFATKIKFLFSLHQYWRQDYYQVFNYRE